MKKLLIAFMLIIVFVLAAAMVAADDDAVSIDVDDWKSPVKDVLKANNVELEDIELKNKTYYIFYVNFQKELTLENEAYFDKVVRAVAAANEFQSFRMEDSTNEIIVEINCKASKVDEIIYNESKTYFADLKALTEKQKLFADTIIKAVPELNDLSQEIAKHKAKMVIKIEEQPAADGEDKYEKEYYLMSIVKVTAEGEEVIIDECRISQDAKDIVWYDEDSEKYLTVAQWRKKIQTVPYWNLD